ncbi:MAG TPA: aromatic ring-hydroxylating dioxygenase subunit alpha, partial [Candidatus Limnocylindria bacterium]|nr:aromatic ring-hydroxylating dioxygenase subunit alpha [Candidatus Limnocylindria bacterium]
MTSASALAGNFETATASTPAGASVLQRWVAQCRPGWSLPGGFYSDPLIYQSDVRSIWRAGWLFAGHSCEIPKPGDFFTMEVDTDSVIVLRNAQNGIRCVHNVCRHRGSLICTETHGHAHKLVCPYHQWTYGLDGKLLACRGMQEDLDKSQFGLHPVHVREVEGMIFVCLAENPPGFESFIETVSPVARPQGMGRAKVAKAVDYLVRANWKLVWENNRECYHCNLNHPQY